MDPPLVNESSFTAASNPSSYSLAGLLSFPNDGGGMTNRGGVEESTLKGRSGGGNGDAKRGRNVKPLCGGDAPVSAIFPNQDLSGLNGKRTKVSRSRDENDIPKIEAEANSAPVERIKPEPPKDYIHVRARRGQATDSHSLAERARREKISERMKILQDLVPGCNKVIGKALVLDEIINYIQSLQHQVEFLSMKLEAVNSTSRMNPTMEDFPLKDRHRICETELNIMPEFKNIIVYNCMKLATQVFDASALLYGPPTLADYARGSQVEWLHMHIGSDFDRAT